MLSTPPRIDPEAIYHDGDVRLLLDLPASTTARARREGRLRYTRQGHAVLYRGQWLIDWLEADSLPRSEGEVSQ